MESIGQPSPTGDRHRPSSSSRHTPYPLAGDIGALLGRIREAREIVRALEDELQAVLGDMLPQPPRPPLLPQLTETEVRGG